ncbi:MAG: hypothetical protein L7U45_00030 [Alphaproteobacteria bacterium]|nr:hypothetical protein [Alphaproteobacteria bacterium]
MKRSIHAAAPSALLAGCLTACLITGLFALPAQAEISYADILADPDNPALNQQFANERLAGGDAKAALAAVERVLVAEPTNFGARLFRAEVLVALGADLQAEGELRALAALPLPADIKRRVKKLRERLSDRQRRFSARLNLALGFMENDNAANWPADNTILLNGAVVDSDGENRYSLPRLDGSDPITEAVKDDVITQNLALSAHYDPGLQFIRDLNISLGVNANSEGESGYLDGETTHIGIGAKLRRGKVSLTPRLSMAEVENDFEDRLGNYTLSSGTLTAQWQARQTTRLSVSTGITELAFDDTLDRNDTSTISGSFGWEEIIGRRLSTNFGSFYQKVDSEENADLDKDLFGASLTVRLGLMQGHFLTLGASYTETEHESVYSHSYDPSDGTPADGKIREDEITGTSIDYLLLGSTLSPLLSHVFFTLGYQSSETESNTIGFSQQRDIFSARVNIGYRF